MLIGCFPLDKRQYKHDAHGPVPSLKMIHLSLEEKKEALVQEAERAQLLLSYIASFQYLRIHKI